MNEIFSFQDTRFPGKGFEIIVFTFSASLPIRDPVPATIFYNTRANGQKRALVFALLFFVTTGRALRHCSRHFRARFGTFVFRDSGPSAAIRLPLFSGAKCDSRSTRKAIAFKVGFWTVDRYVGPRKFGHGIGSGACVFCAGMKRAFLRQAPRKERVDTLLGQFKQHCIQL